MYISLWVPSLRCCYYVTGDALVAARTVQARGGAHRPSCSMKAMNLGRSTHSWSILRLLSTPRVSALNQSPTLKSSDNRKSQYKISILSCE